MRSRPHLELDLNYGFLDAQQLSQRLENPLLVSNGNENSMLSVVLSELSAADSFVFSVAFVTEGGLGSIRQELVDFAGRGTIITSDYQDFNEPNALRDLLAIPGINARIMEGTAHHAKGYVFHHDDHVTAIVGSSNLTRSALVTNREWNLRFSTHRDGDIADQLSRATKAHLEQSVPLTEEWIARYEKRRKVRSFILDEHGQPAQISPTGAKVLPNLMQVEALSKLREVIEAGESKALIISATGTGKTILAALAARDFAPKRMLFVAHREQILHKAAEEFARVMNCDHSEIGFFVGSRREVDRKFVFATVQSLSRGASLGDLSPLLFDLVIVDEVHRSGARSYQDILRHFRPSFTLGLTATPERTDGFNIFELFDYNVAYEIRLQEALKAHMLVPFDYYGISDYQSAHDYSIGDGSELSELTSEERTNHIARGLADYSFARGTKGLIFCSSNNEARALAEKLNQRHIHGKLLRTRALSGADSVSQREEAVQQLESGDLDYLLTVDIFNEGIDIPRVNVVVMLRSTESSIIFTQQLGRGLRKFAGKHSLRVIDFIGNYASNFLIPIALTGNKSGDKNELREGLAAAKHKALAGASTVSFDKVSEERIFESLNKARIADKRAKKEAILNLQYRIGRLPQLADFEHHEVFSPVILATTSNDSRNYWSLLYSLKFVDIAPSNPEEAFLTLLSGELLNGKRPQELLLLKELLRCETLRVDAYRELLAEHELNASDLVMDSVERIVNLDWFVQSARSRYGGKPLAQRNGDEFRIGELFYQLYHSYAADHPNPATSFRAHVDDIIESALLLNRKHFDGSDSLIIGKAYSRKDVCRVLNWPNNNEGTIMGYRVDSTTKTCPIFVTYHKDADVTASTRYGDELIDPSTMHWFSRHGRTLKSKELQPILENNVDIHLFVKREDSDGLEFRYLGRADSNGAQQTTMPGNKDNTLDVVTTSLKLRVPIPQNLFNALTTPKHSSATQ